MSKFSDLSEKINSFLSNIEFKTLGKTCKLEFDNEKSFARPIWILGNMYTPDYSSLMVVQKSQAPNNGFNLVGDVYENLEFFRNARGDTFLNDFYSKIWFSYRRNFPPIKYFSCSSESGPGRPVESQNSQLSSDVGWGCVIRCTQMLLAQALVIKLLTRSWRKLETPKGAKPKGAKLHASINRNQTSSSSSSSVLPSPSFNMNSSHSGFNSLNLTSLDKRNNSIYLNILSWFLDFPGNSFSIHTMCELIIEELKCDNWQPGQWLGPATAANIICQSVEIAKCGILSLQLADLHVYVARDSLIDPDEVYPHSSDSQLHPQPSDSVLILIPLRLGTSEFNLEYKNSILKLFCFDNFLGIIGGKPRKSFYFIGAQGDELIYLDPHFVQEAETSFGHGGMINTSSFHCQTPRTLNIAKIDPTMSLGFYFENKEEFDDFRKFCDASRVFYRTSDVDPQSSPYRDTQFKSRTKSKNNKPSNPLNNHNNPACPMVSFGCRKDLDRSDLIIDFDDLRLVDCNNNSRKSSLNSDDHENADKICKNGKKDDKKKEPFVFL